MIQAILFFPDIFFGTQTSKRNYREKVNTSGNYTSPQCYINKVGNLTKEGEYYSQTYSVSSNVPLRDYYVYQISGLPSGSYFASTNGSQKTTFSAGENFKVYIPQKSIVSNVSAYIGVAEERCVPVFI